MKVPVSTTIQTYNSGTGKPLSFDDTVPNTAFQAHEPTSVLDLQSSPSSGTGTGTGQPPFAANNNNHHSPTSDLDNLDGWDSILSELGLNDEFTPNSKLWSQISPSDAQLPQFPDFPSTQPFDHNLPPSEFKLCDFSYNPNPNPNPNFGGFDLQHNPYNNNNNNNFGLEFIDDLIKAAQAFESNDSHQVHVILTRLNQRFRSPTGKPLHRAAFYFKEALIAATAGPTRPDRLSSYEVVQTIRAYKAFSGISPVSLFSTFAANQAILEAVDGDGAFIHIVDFDIGYGGHWASFIRELVDKTDQAKLNSMMLRITAIVPEEFGIEGKLVRENLTQFARDLNINFHIDYILFQSFEILSFKSIKFMDGEKVAVHLSPAVFHRLGSGISKFVAGLRAISPSSVVVVDREIGFDIGTSSFSANFVAGIEYYTGMLESLDVATAGGFIEGADCVRRIETFVLRPRIMAAVEAAAGGRAGRRKTWRETFAAAGIRPVGLSQFADFQAECLLRRAQVGGFHVAKRHGEMMLYWHDRPLVSTSAWK